LAAGNRERGRRGSVEVCVNLNSFHTCLFFKTNPRASILRAQSVSITPLSRWRCRQRDHRLCLTKIAYSTHPRTNKPLRPDALCGFYGVLRAIGQSGQGKELPAKRAAARVELTKRTARNASSTAFSCCRTAARHKGIFAISSVQELPTEGEAWRSQRS